MVVDENTIIDFIEQSGLFKTPNSHNLLGNPSSNELLLIPTLQARFYADMIKDMGVPFPNNGGGLIPHEITQILDTAFGFKLNGTPNSYKSSALSTRYKNAMNMGGISHFVNILKTSTLAIAGYSNALYHFYESGSSIDKVCSRITKCKIVDTASAHLDTAGKSAGDEKSYLNITIDSNTFESFGFPSGCDIKTDWVDDECTIQINKSKPINLVPTRGPELNHFTLGNAQKNKLLQELNNAYNLGNSYKLDDNTTLNNIDIPTFMKNILLVKEYGDVLQILEYLAVIQYLESLSNSNVEINKKIRSMFNMQTTDSVVFELCVSLGLSCTYTGSRENVTSGGITVVMYESTPVDPIINAKNIINSMYEGFKSQLNALKFGVNSGLVVLSSLSYPIPDGWIAPGKRASNRYAYTISAEKIDIANIFYPNDKIKIHDANNPDKNMNSTESIKFKMDALRILSTAIDVTLNNLYTTYNTIISAIDSSNAIDLLPYESSLQTSATIRFTIGTDIVEAPYNEPPLAKVKDKGWVIQNNTMIQKFAEYSGYVKPNTTLPHTVVAGGKKGLRNPVQSKKKPVQSKKKPVQYGGVGNEFSLGLEECIYLMYAISEIHVNNNKDSHLNEIDRLRLTLKYNDIVANSTSGRLYPYPIPNTNTTISIELYPSLLLKFGGYRVYDGLSTGVSMDEEKSNIILSDMNQYAVNNLHIADTDHIAELQKLTSNYLYGISHLLQKSRTRKSRSTHISDSILFLSPSVCGDVNNVSYKTYGQLPCVSLIKLLEDTLTYLTFSSSEKLKLVGTYVFVMNTPGVWVEGIIKEYHGDNTFTVSNRIGITVRLPASHIKFKRPADLTIGEIVFVYNGISWVEGKIEGYDKVNKKFTVSDININSKTVQLHADDIKFEGITLTDLINSVIDDFGHFWVNTGSVPKSIWFQIIDPNILTGLNEMFSIWNNESFISNNNFKTKTQKHKIQYYVPY